MKILKYYFWLKLRSMEKRVSYLDIGKMAVLTGEEPEEGIPGQRGEHEQKCRDGKE